MPSTVPFRRLRPSAVSLQVAAGVPLEVVSKRIRHSQISLTANTYAHLLPETDRAATALLDAYLAANKPPGN